ncbi:hypothetical protein AKI39_00800 [Bordetella sp. H567]|uniref:DUF1840 domain-containing protein n=1 Tax=Bordetella sp. H567 TaxID=1697043 RepID=UPI00081CC7CB|nr:DUF1840 domain-containing protein [Bordetella sp. H567]AOB29529.1 hypothetical protein AKI39_00800 [Bordetella sp. H567]
MLISFRSKAGAEVLMLSHHAAPLLRAAGKTVPDAFPERGVFTPEQLPQAIAGIEKAVALAPHHPEDHENDPDAPAVHPMARPVGLQQRAYPLLDLMKKALAKGVNVTWELASSW